MTPRVVIASDGHALPVFVFVSLLRRQPTLSREEFVRYHRDQHGPRLVATPEAQRHMRRYTIDFPGPPPMRPETLTTFDAVVRMWFDTEDDWRAVFTSASYTEYIQPDERRFIDLESSEFYAAEETAMIPGP